MTVLIDTDAFCKLGVAGLLEPSVAALGSELRECARLPSLPHMLRRGALPRIYGDEACDNLLSLIGSVPSIDSPAAHWLDHLVPVDAIDPGEAQVFAKAAETDALVLTGDKRALQALARVPVLPQALSGRIVVLEAILGVLCQTRGPEAIRAAVRPILHADTVIRMCFSGDNPSPAEGLASYFADLRRQVDPLELWTPTGGARE